LPPGTGKRVPEQRPVKQCSDQAKGRCGEYQHLHRGQCAQAADHHRLEKHKRNSSSGGAEKDGHSPRNLHASPDYPESRAAFPVTIAESIVQSGVFPSRSPCCLDGGDVDLSHRHHRLEGALCLTAASRQRIGKHARGDLPGKAPAVLAPAALAFRSAIADDRVPVTVRLFLIVRRDLEGKGLAVPERRTAVETETGNAQDGEIHRQHIALPAARIVTGSLVNSGYFTIRKGRGVKARRLKRIFVEPETDRVLWLHVSMLPARSGSRQVVSGPVRLGSHYFQVLPRPKLI